MLAVCGNSVSQTENVNQTQQNVNQTQQKEKMELSLSMERTECFGSCPAYKLHINPDGKVLFEGISFTKTKGKIEGFVDENKISQLITEIEKADFFSLKDSYTGDSINCPLEVSDSASVKINIKLNGKEKTINHYLGCWENDRPTQNDSTDIKIEKDWSPKVFPQQLYNLENKIDEIVETKRWIGERK